MSAAFGSGLVASGNRRLTVDLPNLRLRVLPKLGQTVTLQWTGAASALDARVTRTAAEGLVIEMAGTSTQVLLRSWPIPAGRRRDTREYVLERMVCPRCDASRNILHWGGEEVGWGCRGRECLNLDFPVRHSLRWCPSVRRRMRLLRQLVRVSPRGLKARRLRAQIAREQRAMLASMRRANRDLTKRRQRQNGQRRGDDGAGPG
jgi:hypothetical protein